MTSSNLQTNPELELAYQYVCNTNKNLFLTGKAGSGKTTFLRKIREARLKRMAIVAPTGVAAINAGGMTIHSLFQIAIGIHLPGVERRQPQGRFRPEKTRLIRSLDLLVIDEVSMVRADLLDAIDEVLRRIRNSSQPFGGVQLLMIGDLHQLPPVVKNDEIELLNKYYDTPYFFGSRALQQTDYVAIELKHIYRQADAEFISLLNQVRDGRLDSIGLQKLNTRYISNFQPPLDIPYITLTATNAAATEINTESLNRLKAKKSIAKAVITGEFPNSSFPTEEELELKVGAQVMFIRNDTSDERVYYNGKLGTITKIHDETIAIRCPGENQDICVAPIEWENIKYTLNEETKAIEENIVGTFTQYPLRHAWAITIHKSQGLTFERCIIDAQAAFASGQVYVALSRCKSFEGIVLRSRIFASSVKTDPVVREFSADTERKTPTERELRNAKHAYQAHTLRSLFNMAEVSQSLDKLGQLMGNQSGSLTHNSAKVLNDLRHTTLTEITSVCDKFEPQLISYLQAEELPEENEALQTRIKKASAYFADKFAPMERELAAIEITTDDEKLWKQLSDLIQELSKLLTVKKLCFAACREGFTAERLNRAKCEVELDLSKPQRLRNHGSKAVDISDHPILFERLLNWRFNTADAKSISEHEIASEQTLAEIASKLPQTKKQLGKISGIGKSRLRNYGDSILNLIQSYARDYQIQPLSPATLSHQRGPLDEPNTKQKSLDMFRSGKTPEVIAAERNLAVSTIVGHLCHFVQIGDLDVSLFLDETTLGEIVNYLNENPDSTLSLTKTHFGEKYDYPKLRFAYAAWRNLAE